MPEPSAAVVDRRLSLMGGWRLVVDGAEVELGHREQRLVALLGLTGRRARPHVAGTHWPDSTDERALASLRRAVLQTQRRCPGLLRADRASIGLDPGVAVDVEELRAAAAGTDALGDEGADHSGLVDALAGEELLPGWYDEWAADERERLQRLRVRALERLARRALDLGDLATAVDAARALSELEPLLESAREVAIRAHLGRGDRTSAHRELDRFREALAAELGVEPSPAVVALLDGVPTPVPTPVPEPVVPVPRQRAAPREEALVGSARVDPAPADPGPGPVRLADFLADGGGGGPVRRRRSRTIGVAVRLVVVAGLVLAVALVLAGVGADGEDGRAQVTSDVPSGRVGAPPATATSPSDEDPAPVVPRRLRVRPVRAGDGAAAFVVRTTAPPARVRLVVRGPAGPVVVRTLVVRGADARRLVVAGLDPGSYRWSATAPEAAPVQGQVRVDEATSATPVRASTAPGPTPSPTTEAPAAPSPSPTSTPTPTPMPTQTPTPSPTPTPTSTPSQTPTPTPTPNPSPTRQPGSSGSPTDPGTQEPGPVG